MSDNKLYIYDVVISHTLLDTKEHTYTVAIRHDEWSGANGELKRIACKLAMDKFLNEVALLESSIIKIDSVKRFNEDEIKGAIWQILEDAFEDVKNGNVENYG